MVFWINSKPYLFSYILLKKIHFIVTYCNTCCYCNNCLWFRHVFVPLPQPHHHNALPVFTLSLFIFFSRLTALYSPSTRTCIHVSGAVDVSKVNHALRQLRFHLRCVACHTASGWPTLTSPPSVSPATSCSPSSWVALPYHLHTHISLLFTAKCRILPNGIHCGSSLETAFMFSIFL